MTKAERFEDDRKEIARILASFSSVIHSLSINKRLFVSSERAKFLTLDIKLINLEEALEGNNNPFFSEELGEIIAKRFKHLR